MNAEWLKEITADDLPDSYREMAKIIGVNNTIALALHYGGLPYYFQKVDSLLQKIRDDKIRQEFNGDNYKALARKYDLSEMHIRRIISGKEKDNGQVELFNQT
ncbi:MAG: DNA-binding protein [Nitrospirae bacterium]|nr:DNA-binding protein [Nitrospirota bacterium]